MHAGQILRSARKAANMTLAELGDCCGYSAAQISRYERDLTHLTDIALLRKMSAVLDLLDQAPGDERHLGLLARCYHLACEGLHKSGSAQAARITADRAVTYARLSGDPAAEAMAARQELAAGVTRAAADRLAQAGLRTTGTANALAQVLCTGAYSAAQAGDRDEAAEMITQARDVVRLLPAGTVPDLTCTTVTHAQVALYEVGIWWSLGEPGTALSAARGLRPAQFPTPERRARLFTDLARVWGMAGRPERAIAALLGACGHAVSEVRDRPSIRSLATGLVRGNPSAAGASRLGAILDSRGRWQA
jgi:transcriptional regulator with XRE-family HTH domain